MFLYRGPEEIINDIIEEGKENYNVWLGIMVSEDHIIKFEIDNNLISL